MQQQYARLMGWAGAFLAAAVFSAAAAAADRVEILDYGGYDHVVTQDLPAPKEISGERTLVSNIKLREQTALIDAQKSRMFGFQFRVNDPALIGKTLTIRKLVARLTNPKTGPSPTVAATHQPQDRAVDDAGRERSHGRGGHDPPKRLWLRLRLGARRGRMDLPGA